MAPLVEQGLPLNVRRCKRCLLPYSFPGIDFDNNGVCNLCREHHLNPPAGEKALLEILSLNKGRSYDVLVGISGGKDSCYVAYLAKKKYGLRVLGVLYDFPFMRDLARENVRNVCRTLDIELEVIKTRKNLEFDLLKNNMCAMAGTGTTWGQCLFCHYGIDAVLYGLAEKKGIPFILGGVTSYELWNPGKRMGFLKERVARLSLPAKFRFGFFQFKAYLNLIAQRREFPIPGNSKFKPYSHPAWPEHGPRLIRVFDYIPWNKDVIEKTLQAEAGWKKPDAVLSWRYDCMLEPLLDFTYLREFGISTVGIYLSNQIRDGLINRDEALGVLRKSEAQGRLDASMHEVCRFLKLPRKVEEQFLRGGTQAGKE
ncbi:MAG: hypothetical protein WBC70_16275 [Candidatus Aminicenantales bacterium]